MFFFLLTSLILFVFGGLKVYDPTNIDVKDAVIMGSRCSLCLRLGFFFCSPFSPFAVFGVFEIVYVILLYYMYRSFAWLIFKKFGSDLVLRRKCSPNIFVTPHRLIFITGIFIPFSKKCTRFTVHTAGSLRPH